MIQQQFKTLAHQNIFERVAGWMREMYGEQAIEMTEYSAFMIRVGSSCVFVETRSSGESDAYINVHAPVTFQTKLTPDLLYFLLKENGDIFFGAFSLFEDGSVVFNYPLRGSTCDKDELRNAVSSVAWAADEYDDVIVARWGGHRAADH